MRPFRIFMFLVAVAVAVAALALVIPGSRYLKVRNTLISFYGHLKPDNVIYTDQDSTSVIFPDADSPEPPADTTKAHKQPQERIAERLQAASDRSVRIMVFGDSQLEGDRITSRLRSLLQQVHGGSGPGMLQPLMPVMYTRAVEVRSSPDWKRYTYLSFRDGIISNRQLGPCMSFCRFLPPDSVMPGEISATVRVTPSMFADSLASLYEGFRLFYGNLKGSCIVTIHADGILVATDTLRSGKGPFMYEKDTGASLDLKITFTGNASPDIYGFSIGADRGIIVDNIPHRGSSGLEFTLADRQSLGDILSFLNPDIIVLHYGLNVVKNVRDDYSYYQRGLERQFLLLRELSPGSELILAGVTDMAENKGGTIKSYANIRYIRDAQKRAAEATGIIFWDAWDAMGGDDAIVRWAENDPPLAQKDYTHLTYI